MGADLDVDGVDADFVTDLCDRACTVEWHSKAERIIFVSLVVKMVSVAAAIPGGVEVGADEVVLSLAKCKASCDANLSRKAVTSASARS